MVGQSKETHMVPDGVRQKFENAGRYELIVVAARRAHDLQTGSKPLIDDWAQHKWSVVALKEIEAGLIPVTYPHGYTEPKDEEEEQAQEEQQTDENNSGTLPA